MFILSFKSNISLGFFEKAISLALCLEFINHLTAHGRIMY